MASHRFGRVSYTPARVNLGINKIPGAYVRLARFFGDCGRIRSGRWWSYIWGAHGMHADSVPVAVAGGRDGEHQNVPQPQRHDIQFRLRNGWAPFTLARNGRGVWYP